MTTLNHATKEILCKIVYYGPGVGGKTTNLQIIHDLVDARHRGEMISLATDQERTLYFDFLPLDLGQIRGFQTKFQLYTVPGQSYYRATRKLVLRGVDGIVFVADSQSHRMDDNRESMIDLEENLKDYGYNLRDIPLVVQYNKRDLDNAATIEELQNALGRNGVQHVEAVAVKGEGVKETLKLISTLVLQKVAQTSGLTADTRQDEPVRPDAEAPGAASADAETEEPSTAAPETPPVSRKAAPARPSKPQNLRIRQFCDFYWGKTRIGSGSVELASRQNLDGRGEYQLAEDCRLLLGFHRVRLHMLTYVGEEVHYFDGRRMPMAVFRAVQGARSRTSDVKVWLIQSGANSIYVRLPLVGRESGYAPEGRKLHVFLS